MLKVEGNCHVLGLATKIRWIMHFLGNQKKYEHRTSLKWTLASSRPHEKEGSRNLLITKSYGDISVSKIAKESNSRKRPLTVFLASLKEQVEIVQMQSNLSE